MIEKKRSRIKRGKKSRYHLKRLGVDILSITRSSKHIRAQVISPNGGIVLATASSLEKDIRLEKSQGSTKSDLARRVGQMVAERALAKDVKRVGFDRSGFKYHGRVKELADGARAAGLLL